MRVKMRIIHIIIISIFISLSLYGQTTNDVILKVKELQQEDGDSIARDYLINNESLFEEGNEQAIYLGLWGQLTSNMWNANPTPSLTEEFKDFLMSIVDESAYSEDFLPEESALPWVWQMTHDYSNILYAEGNKEKALFMLGRIHKWFESYPNYRNTVGYARSLLNYCILLVRDMHKYEEGTPYIEEYAKVTKNVYGEKSAQYAVALNNMCYIPSKTTEEKIELLQEAISIYEAADYKDPAMLNQMKASLNSAQALLTGIVQTDSIPSNSQNLLSLNDCMALVVAEKGAEALESLNYYKEVLARDQYLDTLRYAEVVNYIITTYIQMNELAKAQKEIDDFNGKIGVDNISPNYAQPFYSSASLVAMRLKDYAKALEFAHAACKLSEQFNAPPIEYCKILANISMMYAEAARAINKQFYLDAKWYIDEAIYVFEEKVGSLASHGSTGLLLLNNKALLYEAIGDKMGAIESLEHIVFEFAENNNVRETWVLATNNLATLYLKTGNTEKAISMLESLSSKNKEYNMMFKQNLALAYYIAGNEKLKEALRDYNKVCYNNCLDVFNFFTEAEREDFWTGNARELLALNNLVADSHPEMTDIAFDNLLFVKNLKLMSSDILRKIVENSSNAELKKRYNRTLFLRNAISYRSNEQDSVRLWSKQLKEEERYILNSIPNYKERLLGAFHSWKEIKEDLGEDEIAIDFTFIPKIKDWGNSDAYGFYGAFVITKDSQIPELVSLCEVDSINQYFGGTATDEEQISTLYKKTSPIYKMVWGKLAEWIKGKKNIYFAPTGQLNLLNHNALIMLDGKRFGDIYNLVRLSTTDKILSLKSKKTNDHQYESAVVYGGIDYDLTIEEMVAEAKKYKYNVGNNIMIAMRSEDERGHWDYLPGTKEESQNVFEILNSDNIPTTLLQNAIANEESFKALSCQSPSIIHLSTHGFFLNTPEKIMTNPFMSKVGSYSENEDKLIRTGVLMAGANNEWCGTNHVSGIEDGILTADEISRLDLSRAKIVVLSACETAKGQVDEIDGILGLQRGFKKAGAKSIMMSLWKVSDTVTALLMTEFYAHLCKGLSANEALKAASRKIKDQYPDPYYWAAFVMLDGLN